MPENIHVIYVMTDPHSQEVRYVGRAKNLQVRLKRHWRGLGTSHVANWIRRLKRLGRRPEVTVLQSVPADHICEAERFWIAHYRALGCPLVNIGGGGEGGMDGARHSAETKAKIGRAHRGKIVSEETRSKLRTRAGTIGPETRAKIGAASRSRSPEANRRIGEANRIRVHTDESRAKKSAAAHGRPQSEETRRKRSETMRGQKKTPEQIERSRLARLGKKQSPETVEKRRLAVKATWARKRLKNVES